MYTFKEVILYSFYMMDDKFGREKQACMKKYGENKL